MKENDHMNKPKLVNHVEGNKPEIKNGNHLKGGKKKSRMITKKFPVMLLTSKIKCEHFFVITEKPN